MSFIDEKTIVARATPAGESAIAVVRLSGKKTSSVLASIFIPFNKSVLSGNLPEKTQILGEMINPDDKTKIDECIVVFTKAPHTYTGEDTAEISSHGNMIITRKIIQACISSGAETAEPGEFTKRAFLNGKLDLSQAEAVCEIISAKTETAHKYALRNLKGKLSEKISEVREKLIICVAEVEARLDFPEDEIEDFSNRKISALIDESIIAISSLIDMSSHGKVFREGAKVIIAGKPNSGKSSLFNDFAGMERAIVSPHPGTTRDFIETTLDLKGIPVTFTDTAGIRDTNDDIESIGIKKTFDEIQDSDLVLFIVDASSEPDKDEILSYQKVKKLKHIIVINKIDITETDKSEILKKLSSELSESEIIKISALQKTGIKILEDKIVDSLLGISEMSVNLPFSDESFLVANLRHLEYLRKSVAALYLAKAGFEAKAQHELVAIDLRDALSNLDDILGLNANESILDHIFSNFCIGK